MFARAKRSNQNQESLTFTVLDELESTGNAAVKRSPRLCSALPDAFSVCQLRSKLNSASRMIRRSWTEIGAVGEGGTSKSSFGLAFLMCATNGQRSSEVLLSSKKKTVFPFNTSVCICDLQDHIYIYHPVVSLPKIASSRNGARSTGATALPASDHSPPLEVRFLLLLESSRFRFHP